MRRKKTVLGVSAAVLLCPLFAQAQPSCPFSYNEKKEEFRYCPGGVHEGYLNEQREPTTVELLYFRRVDTAERSCSFTAAPHDGIVSRISTYVAIQQNIEILEKIESISFASVPQQYRRVKELLLELQQKVDEATPLTKIEVMYNTLLQNLGPKKENGEARNLESLLRGESRDCNDTAAAFFAVYHHFKIPVFLRIGKVQEKSEEEMLHAWISIETDYGFIDLDPTFYPRFVPLENRNRMVKMISYDELKQKK